MPEPVRPGLQPCPPSDLGDDFVQVPATERTACCLVCEIHAFEESLESAPRLRCCHRIRAPQPAVAIDYLSGSRIVLAPMCPPPERTGVLTLCDARIRLPFEGHKEKSL